jgi:hypothetical protein
MMIEYVGLFVKYAENTDNQMGQTIHLDFVLSVSVEVMKKIDRNKIPKDM